MESYLKYKWQANIYKFPHRRIHPSCHDNEKANLFLIQFTEMNINPNRLPAEGLVEGCVKEISPGYNAADSHHIVIHELKTSISNLKKYFPRRRHNIQHIF